MLEVSGYHPDNVIDLRDADQAKLESVFGNERSYQGLLWRYLNPKGGSDILVFYSGHGVPGLKDKRGYLLPVNADPDTAEINGYPLNLLYENLSKLKAARSVRVFVDACFSGGSDLGMLVHSASPMTVKADLPEAMKKMTVVTAASDSEVASWDREAQHGLFTHHLLDALYGKGDADRDGTVTAAEVKGYLDDHMTRAARRTYGRLQHAMLDGDEAVVLATAREGGFVARPVLKPGDLAPVATIGAQPEASVEKALGLKREARVLIQRGLASLKFEAGPADGLFGKKTRRAIKAWQEEKGFAATGHLTGEQAQALEEAGMADKERVEREKAKREPLAREAVEREKSERDARGEAERRHGLEFRDCAECPEIVAVPAGEFMMGLRDGERGRSRKPRHRVRIGEALAVGKYEVTFGEWDTCVAGGGCNGYRPDDRGWGRGRRPVVNVSWDDAKAYVRWLSERTGAEYRLLSEAEWEYVARAGTSTAYWWGDEVGSGRANCDGCGSEWDGKQTAPVGSFEANPFGLHDVHGNVLEWVEDCWHKNYGGAPMDGSAWTRDGDCGERVMRSAAWMFAWSGDSADRSSFWRDARDDTNGFRVARTLTP